MVQALLGRWIGSHARQVHTKAPLSHSTENVLVLKKKPTLIARGGFPAYGLISLTASRVCTGTRSREKRAGPAARERSYNRLVTNSSQEGVQKNPY